MKRINTLIVIVLAIVSQGFAAVTWDGTASAWTQGSGTQADPYLIETPMHLAYLAQQVNAGTAYEGKYFKQTQDFDMNSKSWTGIGTASQYFKGNYDGGEYTCSNLTNAYGLFRFIDNATIKNLTITGSNCHFVTYASNNCKMINLHNKASQTYFSGYSTLISSYYETLNSYYWGGICCYINQIEGTSCLVKDCSFEGQVTFTGLSGYQITCGGIVGIAGSNTIVSQCWSIGSFTLASSYLSDGWYAMKNYTVSAIGIGAKNINKCYSVSEFNITGGKDYIKIYGIGYASIIEYCYFRSTNTNFGSAIECVHHCYQAIPITSTAAAATWDVYTNASTTMSSSYYTNDYTKLSRSSAYMQSQAFVEQLNNGPEQPFCMDYTGINDGYPILKWQLEYMTKYQVKAICQESQGTVSGGGEYPASAKINIEATPKEGFVFTGWSDGVTDNPRQVTVSGDATYVAQFTQNAYTIYVNQDCTIDVE